MGNDVANQIKRLMKLHGLHSQGALIELALLALEASQLTPLAPFEVRLLAVENELSALKQRATALEAKPRQAVSFRSECAGAG